MQNNIDLAGLKISALPKNKFLLEIEDRLKSGKQTWITTLYSEFLHAAILDKKVASLLNQADLSAPDGIGILWAAKYLSIPISAKPYYAKIIQAVWQAKYSLAAILFKPQWIKSAIPEKISGSELVWDLAGLAEKNGWSVFLLGGYGDTGQLAADRLKQKHPGLKIAGCSNKNPDDLSIAEDIKNAKADMLFVAYGPIKQELWISENFKNLPAKLAIGLGGTFDYLAGERLYAPKFIRDIGLEWLFRLLTQPQRLKRIINGTLGLVAQLIKYKVRLTLPYRKNVVAVIINRQKEILIGLEANPKIRLQNNPGDQFWMLPQGGLEPGEDPVRGARREVQEETGIASLEFLFVSPSINSYMWPLQHKTREYKGQEQQIVYFNFVGQDAEINLNNHHIQEFTDYRWVPLDKLASVINEEKKPLAAIIEKDLKISR